ncbi:R2-like ligand-binding oxidase [Bacillus sp. JJ1521]|uniref:R2-like ligand-binding oxidase n=1 Tax=Bacillus sp. JJ1521 TaxID=3122957 RepID=UPI002FFEA530
MRKEIILLTRGIDEESFPFQLFQKAKQFGVWNPSDIDFSQDKEDWKKLTPEQRETMRLRISKFVTGEESVTSDILPMIMTVARKGWLEEEMYLTTFLFEEAKHVDLFRILLKEIGETEDLSKYHDANHKNFFYEMLPTKMNRILDDPSPQNMAEGAAFYNIFLEGIQAETAYYTLFETLQKVNMFPGLIKGVTHLKHDESRHISFGTYIIQRLMSKDPELYDFVEHKVRNEWWPIAEELYIAQAMGNHSVDAFGLKVEDMLNFAKKQMNVRLEILKRGQLYRPSKIAY